MSSKGNHIYGSRAGSIQGIDVGSSSHVSQITNKTQKELYKVEIYKVWDIVYAERQKVSAAEKRVVALEKELSKLNMIVEAQERDRDSWL